jgi:hypothetical protein
MTQEMQDPGCWHDINDKTPPKGGEAPDWVWSVVVEIDTPDGIQLGRWHKIYGKPGVFRVGLEMRTDKFVQATRWRLLPIKGVNA